MSQSLNVTKLIRHKVNASQTLYGTKFIYVTKFIITKFIKPKHGKLFFVPAQQYKIHFEVNT
jgi:hypothetical protein